jgi:hypothetical protein
MEQDMIFEWTFEIKNSQNFNKFKLPVAKYEL